MLLLYEIVKDSKAWHTVVHGVTKSWQTQLRLNNKELLGHMVVLFLISLETYILFSTVAAPMYIPTKSV